MFETVVVATDGSESTERAVCASFDLTERFDAQLHALTVVEADADAHSEAQAALDELTEQTDRTVTTVVEVGEPAPTIIEYASRVGADVVVTGIRGRDGPYQYHLGSVAETLVYECPVPVLTIRQPEGEEPV